MKFRTEIPLVKSSFPMDYQSKILLMGSCFAENIGEKFQYFKFQSEINPFGIIFNSTSLLNLLRRSVQKRYFTAEDVFYHNDLWHCFEVHSELSNTNRDVFLENLNRLVDDVNTQAHTITHLQITLGTAWVYRAIASNEIVANCHKVPQKEFNKELLSVTSITDDLHEIIELLGTVNSKCKIIFTVSPVRHIKDGFVENTVSKAHLITAVNAVVREYNSKVEYFPSFEIMMDELRDYRFYAEDMLHPNQVAVDYIWSQFVQNYLSNSAFELMREVDAIQKGLAHRSFNEETESHQKFLKNLSNKILNLNKKLPHITF
ncbi:GSCFA domain-containing protein [Flavobacterium chuncheonense]|uniref:GSCFA domain-containing protein n=1 Tax=Flavobacterium chuncheonense TaxID=2026653 RepID=A0ABW5YKX4_9FLAO